MMTTQERTNKTTETQTIETTKHVITETAALALVETQPSPVPTRFAAPTDADTLVDALVAGQLSPRTRLAYASDLAELLGVLAAWNLTLTDVTRDHLHAYRAWLAGEPVVGLTQKDKPAAPATVSRKVSVCRQLFA